MTLDENIIREFNLKLKPVVRKDTKTRFCIIPEAPYDEYAHGIIFKGKEIECDQKIKTFEWEEFYHKELLSL